MTLFQYDTDEKYSKNRVRHDSLLEAFYKTAINTGNVVFLGLKRNVEVGLCVCCLQKSMYM